MAQERHEATPWQTSQRSKDEQDMEVLSFLSLGFRPLRSPAVWAAILILLKVPNGSAQQPCSSLGDVWREPLLPGSLDPLRLRTGGCQANLQASSADARIRLFRMNAGYPVDPVGILDSDSPGSAPDQPRSPESEADLFSRISVAAGNDNPYFDFRRPGDPGGVGYFRVQSQLQFLDTGKTGCTLGLNAAGPAGLEYDGLQDGPTVVFPSLGWYYDLGDGAGLHGFVGKNVRAGGGWTDNLSSNVEFGFALHHPMPSLDGGINRNLFLFVQALGRHHPELANDPRRPSLWEVLPGVHYRLNDNWWMSGGVILPIGSSRSDLGLWQVTCSWQF
jgi:hypothetical protein